MKKLQNILLLLSFQFGFMQWGKNNTLFVFQVYGQLFQQGISNPATLFHPLIIIPFIGTIILLYTLFQSIPGKKLTLIGMGCMGIFMLLLLFIGITVPKFKIIISTLPFFAISLWIIVNFSHSKRPTS
jgi:hypothetical protein